MGTQSCVDHWWMKQPCMECRAKYATCPCPCSQCAESRSMLPALSDPKCMSNIWLSLIGPQQQSCQNVAFQMRAERSLFSQISQEERNIMMTNVPEPLIPLGSAGKRYIVVAHRVFH